MIVGGRCLQKHNMHVCNFTILYQRQIGRIEKEGETEEEGEGENDKEEENIPDTNKVK